MLYARPICGDSCYDLRTIDTESVSTEVYQTKPSPPPEKVVMPEIGPQLGAIGHRYIFSILKASTG